MPTGDISDVFSYCDPPLGTGFKPTANTFHCIITRNEQFFHLANEDTNRLKYLLNNVLLVMAVLLKMCIPNIVS